MSRTKRARESLSSCARCHAIVLQERTPEELAHIRSESQRQLRETVLGMVATALNAIRGIANSRLPDGLTLLDVFDAERDVEQFHRYFSGRRRRDGHKDLEYPDDASLARLREVIDGLIEIFGRDERNVRPRSSGASS